VQARLQRPTVQRTVLGSSIHKPADRDDYDKLVVRFEYQVGGVRYVDKQQWPVVVGGIDGKLQELLGVQPLPKATARLASNQIPRKISPLPLEIPPQVSRLHESAELYSPGVIPAVACFEIAGT